MPLISLNNKQISAFRAGNKFYLLKRYKHTVRVIDFTCPHRGGPLVYGRMTSSRKEIICPWHQGRYAVKAICTRTVPSITINNKTILLLEDRTIKPVVSNINI